MIYPTAQQLLAGIADALKDTVLPDLARGTAARKQLQSAIEILRRMAFAAPKRDAALAADNADMAAVLREVDAMLSAASYTTQSPSPIEGETLLNESLQTALTELQDSLSSLPPRLEAQITPLLTGLYTRMTDRALALIPPPMPRTPRKSA